MALRLIQIVFPGGVNTEVERLLDGREVFSTWRDLREGEIVILDLVVSADETEAIMDRFEQEFAALGGFRMALLPVEAVLPRPKEEPDTSDANGDEAEPPAPKTQRISREELLHEALDAAEPSRVFLALTCLSSVVAAVGLIRNDVAVIIGAMVIAPLLGPNVAMTLATVLGDTSLARKALKSNLSGVGIALALSLAIGLFWHVDPTVPAIASRTQIGYDDLVVALAAGAAATFAFTSGSSGAVIGVMVAVALLPPLVTFGMLLGSGYLRDAMGAGLLTMGNIICINLAGVVTFLAQGVKPSSWWEAEQSKKATIRSAAIWFAMLAALVVILFFTQHASK